MPTSIPGHTTIPSGPTRAQIEVEEPWADFHLYALEWYEDRMDFFLDDSLYFTFENDQAGNNDTWPFDKPITC
jgi:beta-glucanase (GH16 family)